MPVSVQQQRRKPAAPPRDPVAPPDRHRRRWWVSALLAAVVATAVAGAAVAVTLLVRGPAGTAPGPAVLRTAYGTVEVGALTVGATHDPQDMIGMPPSQAHGMSGELTVMVPVTVTNTGSDSVTYSPADFRLVAAGSEVPAASAEDGPRTLRPGAAITLRLSFAASAADDAQLRYTAGDGEVVLTELGPIVPGAPADRSAGPVDAGTEEPAPGGAPVPAPGVVVDPGQATDHGTDHGTDQGTDHRTTDGHTSEGQADDHDR